MICGASGEVNCAICGGSGLAGECPTCDATELDPCPVCSKSGNITCPVCEGDALYCSICLGTAIGPCSVCNGGAPWDMEYYSHGPDTSPCGEIYGIQRVTRGGNATDMAIELAPDRIRVNALNPVAGDTPLLPTFLGEDTPENREAFRATIPLGRLSTPADVAAGVVFLASDAAALITGVCLEIDGGRCI